MLLGIYMDKYTEVYMYMYMGLSVYTYMGTATAQQQLAHLVAKS